MTLASEMAADIADAIADFPASWSYRGASHACTCSPVTRSAQVEAEGVFQNFDLELVSASYAGDIPNPKEVIQVTDANQGISAVNYWVMESIRDFGGLTLRVKRGRQ